MSSINVQNIPFSIEVPDSVAQGFPNEPRGPKFQESRFKGVLPGSWTPLKPKNSKKKVYSSNGELLTLSGKGGYCTDISKCSEGDETIFFFHRDIRNKKVCRVKKFQVWVASRYFE